MTKCGIFLFRRDLRVYDNLGLYHCLNDCDYVYPLFVVHPEQVVHNPYKSLRSILCMFESLEDLNIQLKNTLHIVYSDSIYSTICSFPNITDVYFNIDFTPYSKKRDTDLCSLLKKNNYNVHCYDDLYLLPISKLEKQYVKFTPFYNYYCNKYKIQKPKELKHLKHQLKVYPSNKFDIHDIKKKINLKPVHKLLCGGRSEGLKQLKNYNWKSYNSTRNHLTIPTSQLSMYLKYGCLSPREVYHTIQNNKYRRQLFWRDFYAHITNCHPHVLEGQIKKSSNQPLKTKYTSIYWNRKYFKEWCKGETGFPIIDACMRQLNTEGYIHNRGRLIVSSFLVKILGIDWKDGERYFAQQLMDYDPMSNNGNWQWIAGTGADSQPYFRIFNPWKQSETHDPDAIYIKTWIHELHNVEPKHIHSWYKYYDTNIYKKPIVDYTEQRKKILEKYKSVFS